ncbi:MAG: peroxiredoxin-like family protein [Zetaproteobacteria bacterium]|nr:peroxiredoxin-like family protein [Zetaproteobacteria bacterium]
MRILLLLYLLCFTHSLQAKVEAGLNVGAMAPLFDSMDIAGKKFSLKEKLQQGPVVIVFYRGGWCPYCNIQLSDIERKLLPQLTKINVSLVAISSDKPDRLTTAALKNRLSFPVISDRELKIIQKYQLRQPLDAKTTQIYKDKLNFDVAEEVDKKITVPAVYVVNQKGNIVYAFAEFNYKVRAPHSDIVAAVKAAQ